MTTTQPRIIRETIEPPRADFELVVPEDLYYLQGHFPGRPVLPGVVQVHWAITLAKQALHLQGEFTGIKALKFHRIIEPSTSFTLTLEHSAEPDRLRFSYSSELGKHSQGSILFE